MTDDQSAPGGDQATEAAGEPREDTTQAPPTGTAPVTSPAAKLGIGEVLGLLKSEFSDVSVSKIRFLEGAGLVRPNRSPSGYRKFSEDDVARLRFILRAQRDEYLPLRVIRSRLEQLEAGGGLHAEAGAPSRDPSGNGRAGTAASEAPAVDRPAGVADPSGGDGAPPAQGLPQALTDAHLGREELCAAAGADPEQLAQLEAYGLITPRGGGGDQSPWYNGQDLVVVRLARDLGRFGLQPRHLRMYKSFAEREAALFAQVVSPVVRQQNPDSRAKAGATLDRLADLGGRLRAVVLAEALASVVGPLEHR